MKCHQAIISIRFATGAPCRSCKIRFSDPKNTKTARLRKTNHFFVVKLIPVSSETILIHWFSLFFKNEKRLFRAHAKTSTSQNENGLGADFFAKNGLHRVVAKGLVQVSLLAGNGSCQLRGEVDKWSEKSFEFIFLTSCEGVSCVTSSLKLSTCSCQRKSCFISFDQWKFVRRGTYDLKNHRFDLF